MSGHLAISNMSHVSHRGGDQADAICAINLYLGDGSLCAFGHLNILHLLGIIQQTEFLAGEQKPARCAECTGQITAPHPMRRANRTPKGFSRLRFRKDRRPPCDLSKNRLFTAFSTHGHNIARGVSKRPNNLICWRRNNQEHRELASTDIFPAMRHSAGKIEAVTNVKLEALRTDFHLDLSAEDQTAFFSTMFKWLLA